MIVLVAEDEAITAVLLDLALRAAGHEVLGPVATVEDALELTERNRPDLALIDIRLLHGGNGVWLARTLCERSGVPTLFLSGQTAQARAASDCAIGLLGKPYGPEEVVAAVATIGELLAGRWPVRKPARLELFRGRGSDTA
jgi:DNA-binding response OmpR family regulator